MWTSSKRFYMFNDIPLFMRSLFVFINYLQYFCNISAIYVRSLLSCFYFININPWFCWIKIWCHFAFLSDLNNGFQKIFVTYWPSSWLRLPSEGDLLEDYIPIDNRESPTY